jgi:hypothetical protein
MTPDGVRASFQQRCRPRSRGRRTLHSRVELEALLLAERLITSGFDRGDISLMASHDVVVRKLRAIYRDPIEVAEAPDLPGLDLVTRDDV